MCRGFYDPRLVDGVCPSPAPQLSTLLPFVSTYPPARLSSIGVGHCWPHYYITREMESRGVLGYGGDFSRKFFEVKVFRFVALRGLIWGSIFGNNNKNCSGYYIRRFDPCCLFVHSFRIFKRIFLLVSNSIRVGSASVRCETM